MEKIFGLGFSKTGSTSLETAFEILGYKVCRGNWRNPYTFYLHALYIHRDFDEIFRLVNYWDAFADAPWGGTELYREIYRRIPNAKFILTVRDAEEWYGSLERLLTMFDLNLETALDSYHSNGMFGSAYFFKHIFGIERLAGSKQKIIDYYNAYNRGVLDFFKGKDATFTVLDLVGGEGWEKLCGFLDREIPPQPFPVENRSVDNTLYLANKLAKEAAAPP